MSSTGRRSSARLQERAADEPQPAKSDAPRRPSSVKRKVINSPPRERKKRKKKRAPSTPPDSSDSNSEFDGDQTDPLLVTRPNLEIVDEALDGAWEVYPNRQMCVIFDPINPLRQFTLGTRTQIPTRHILDTLGVQTTSDSNVPSGYRLGTF